ncbi:ATP-dependent DNA helicase [Trichonephila clavipes]|nr:ATP-dependent DNA helicase [Trichonephila clavipes]
MRTLFAIILTTCFPSNPKDLWEKYKNYMSEDILHRLRAANQNPDIQFTPNVYNEALIFIVDICLTIANKGLVQLGMTASNRPANNLFDRDFQRETHYDSDELRTFVRTNLPQLILEQRIAYDRIMRAITEQSGGLFFIDAPGGTGKTFFLSLILATIRSQNNIALAIASSGIAATLLDGGRTTHSALKLPLNFQNTEAPTCNISKNSGMGKVLQTYQIIIWDECTMSHKKALEALDRTLRDFRGNKWIFGGALILLSGDFRQTLPIIPRSTPVDELHACLKSSVLWRHLQKLTLKTNMCVQLQRDASAGNFAKQLMDIGNGRMEIDESTQCITLPANFSAKNIDVNTINFTIQHGIPSETTTYKSIDAVENQDEVVNYPTEFLNSLDLPGMPPHVLTLKIGVPIILLRNINPSRLCNGTRLSVKKMMNNVIQQF